MPITKETLEQDKRQLEQQVVLIQGAILFVQQKLDALKAEEEKPKEEK